MTEEPNIETIRIDQLCDKVRALREQGMRLVQISATLLPDEVELTYSFDLNDPTNVSSVTLIVCQRTFASGDLTWTGDEATIPAATFTGLADIGTQPWNCLMLTCSP